MTVLQASGLTVRYGDRTVLKGAGLRAVSGEFVAVVGPNGAGKSTLLRLLAGLSQADEGDVRLDGSPLARLDRRAFARRRAYLPQNARCEWPISVERLVALGLTPTLPAFGDLPPADKARVDAALEACDLVPRRGQAATTLSGGELARAMLARALVADPELLIFDEPLAGLDPRHAYDVAQRLRRLADSGRLVIASIHDLTIAVRYATRVLVLAEGEILTDGPASSSLRPELLARAFGVPARMVGAGAGAFIEIAPP